MLYRNNKIYIGDSKVHGRGVFASEFIEKNEILEECHFIIVPRDLQYPNILVNHFFAWPKGKAPHELAICLGSGSIFNHSDIPNADWVTDESKYIIRFFAIDSINPGDEIFTNYQKTT